MGYKVGEAPWEKKAATSTRFAVGSAPWEKAQPEAPVVDEAADVGFLNRFVAKNFANSPEAQAAYIQKQHPGSKTKIIDGEVAVQMPGDSAYKRLDPSSLELADIGDLAYDIPAGVAQGVATTAGAAAGSVAGPAGTLGGGMAASGASSAGIEYLRQKLGQALGIPQEVDGKQVAITGAVGTVAPAIFGVGKLGSGAVAKYAAQKGITEEAAKEALEKGGRGLLERGYDWATRTAAPKVGELVSGVDSNVIKSYANNMDQVDQLEKTGVMDYTQRLTDKVNDTLGAAKTRTGQELQSIMEDAGSKVNVAGAKNAFQTRISQLEARPDLTIAEQNEINALKAYYNRHFGLAKEVVPDINEINKTPEMQRMFAHLDTVVGDTSKPAPIVAPANLTNNIINDMPAAPKLTYQPEHDSFLSAVNKTVNSGVDEHVARLDAEAAELAKYLNQQQQALTQAKNQQQVDAILNGIKETQARLKELNTQRYIPDQIDATRAFDLQKGLKQAAAFETNMTPETAAAKGSARNAYGALNEAFDRATGGLSTEGKQKYAKLMQIEGELGSSFDTAQKTYNTVTGLNAKSRKMLGERLKKLSDEGKLDINNEVEVLQAYNAFADPSLVPVGFKGATSTSRTIPLSIVGSAVGGALGWGMGGGAWGAGLGALAGGAAGSKVGSPAAIKQYIKLGKALEAGGRAMQPRVGYGAIANPVATEMVAPWLYMGPNE